MSTPSVFPRDAMLAQVLAVMRHRVSACMCVCLSVTRRYCIKTAKRRITEITPRDSPGTLVFGHLESLVDYPLPLKFALKVTHHSFEHHNFDQHPLIAPQP